MIANSILTMCALLITVGCASTPKPRHEAIHGHQRDDSVQATGLRVPKVLAAMPQEGIIDLGPVLIPEAPGTKVSPMRALLEAADRLGADAFVFEGRGIREAYPIKTVRVRTLYDGLDRHPFDTVDYLYVGPYRLGKENEPQVGFYRALRYVDERVEPCRIDKMAVGEKLWPLLEGANTVREQMRLLHTMFAQGLLEPERYRRIRRSCTEHIEHVTQQDPPL